MNLKPNIKFGNEILEHSERRIFTIPLGGISREEAEKQIRELMSEYHDDGQGWCEQWEAEERKKRILEKRDERKKKIQKIYENSNLES